MSSRHWSGEFHARASRPVRIQYRHWFVDWCRIHGLKREEIISDRSPIIFCHKGTTNPMISFWAWCTVIWRRHGCSSHHGGCCSANERRATAAADNSLPLLSSLIRPASQNHCANERRPPLYFYRHISKRDGRITVILTTSYISGLCRTGRFGSVYRTDRPVLEVRFGFGFGNFWNLRFGFGSVRPFCIVINPENRTEPFGDIMIQYWIFFQFFIRNRIEICTRDAFLTIQPGCL